MSKEVKISFEDLIKQVENLSLSEMRKLNTSFIKKHNENNKHKRKIDNRIQSLVMSDLQQHVIDLKINDKCPKCGSRIIVKNGKRNNGVVRLKCQECNHQFTPFTGTFLDKTRYSWDVWIEIVFHMLNHTSINRLQQILKDDYHCENIHWQTIHSMKLKIMNAAKYIEQPTLSGIIEIDETYFREGQKGKKHPIDPANPTKERPSRQYRRMSRYGVMGPEFSNIVCAIDRSGHCVIKFVGMGCCSFKKFEEEFREYIEDAQWICTDCYRMYKIYTEKYNVNHYVRPSNYLTVLHQGKEEGKTEEEMYNADLLDYIEAHGKIQHSFKKFREIKKQSKLSLAHVNKLHAELTDHLERFTHGVCTVNLEEYCAWESVLFNYRADYGHYPSSKNDAENIIKMLLKTKQNLHVKDMRNRKPDFSKANTQYTKRLIQLTEEMKEKTNDPLFLLTAEDVGANFNLDEFLKTLPKSHLYEIGKLLKIKDYTKMVRQNHLWKLRKEIERHPNVHEAIAEYRIKHPSVQDQYEKDLESMGFSRKK